MCLLLQLRGIAYLPNHFSWGLILLCLLGQSLWAPYCLETIFTIQCWTIRAFVLHASSSWRTRLLLVNNSVTLILLSCQKLSWTSLLVCPLLRELVCFLVAADVQVVFIWSKERERWEPDWSITINLICYPIWYRAFCLQGFCSSLHVAQSGS